MDFGPLTKLQLKPGSVDSLHGGFVTSRIYPVSMSKIRNKKEMLSAMIIKSERITWKNERIILCVFFLNLYARAEVKHRIYFMRPNE